MKQAPPARAVRVLIALPARTVHLRGEVTHCWARGGDGAEEGFAVGVRIIEMSRDDRRAYAEYLRSLG